MKFYGPRILTIAGGLHFEHFLVPAAQACQLFVTSFFCNPSVFEHYDAVGHAHGGKSVRNKERHLPRGEFGKALENLELAARIERGGGFVKNQKLRVAQVGARQRNFLPLSAGKIDAGFEAPAQHLIVTAGKSSQ